MRKDAGLELGQLGLFGWGNIALLEDLVVGLEGTHEVQQPPLVGYVLVINANEGEIVQLADTEELLHQYFFARRSGARQHSNLIILGAEDFTTYYIPHVVLSDHSGLELGQVIAIPLYRLIEVSAVLDEAGELVNRHLLGVCIGSLNHGLRDVLLKISIKSISLPYKYSKYWRRPEK